MAEIRLWFISRVKLKAEINLPTIAWSVVTMRKKMVVVVVKLMVKISDWTVPFKRKADFGFDQFEELQVLKV